MARLPTPGSDDGTWGTILNDYLAQAHNSDGSLKDTGIVASKYVKPSGGIPESDLASAVQAKLAAVSTKVDKGELVKNALDYANVQTALNATGNILFPAGAYTATTLNLTNVAGSFDGILVEGAGWDQASGGTEITLTGSTGPLVTVAAESSSAGFINRVTFRNISFHASSASLTGALVRLLRCSDVLFENCYFYGSGAGTLVEGCQWVTVRFRNCKFSFAATGVKMVAVSGFTPNFANVIKFEDCWFSELDTSADLTAACRSTVFDHCTFERANNLGAAPVLVAGHSAAFTNGCWFGDANGTGTWITATGDILVVRDCEIGSAATAIDAQTLFKSTIESNSLNGTGIIVKQSGQKIVARDNRVILTANNAIGFDVTTGEGHVIEDNDVTISGGVTGTTGYRFAAGTTGVFRDMKPGNAATTVTDNSTSGGFSGWDKHQRVQAGHAIARIKLPFLTTAQLPAAGNSLDNGFICIEDNGSGDRNLVFYLGGQRFRIDGGTNF